MTATPARRRPNRGAKERGLWFALLASLALHVAGLAGAHAYIPRDGKVVRLERRESPRPRVNIELVDARRLPPPPAAPSAQPRQSPAVVAPVRPQQPLAAPKRGRIVLPDEALEQPAPPPAEITAQLPSLPPEHVVPQSQAGAPVIATPEVFSRAASLALAAPSEYGLGGTGEATGSGPFGTDPEGGGTSEAPGHALTPTEVEATPQPRPPAPQPRPSIPPPAAAPPATSPPPAGLTRPPAPLNWTDPPYPEPARREGREGTVVLRVTVSPEGKPARVEIAVSSGSSTLDLAALSHMRSARFSPALQQGEPVEATVSFRVRFRLISPSAGRSHSSPAQPKPVG